MGNKILVIFHDNDFHSGATKSFLSNVLYLKKSGYTVHAIIPKKDGDLVDKLLLEDIKTYKLTYGGSVYYNCNSVIKRYKEYIRCLIKTTISYINCLIFFNQHKYNYICIYSNTSTIYCGAWLANFYKIKHIWHFREFLKEDQNTVRILNELFIKYSKKAYCIITISQILENYYKEKLCTNNLTCLYNDIDKSYCNVEKINRKTINILITGTLCDEKGQIFAIKALKLLNNENVHLFIAGKKNNYYEYLLDYISKNNIKNVHFLGLVKDMKTLRKNIDFSLVCAKKEAFGRTIIEDMLANIVVIGCDTGAVPELIKNNYTGFIYKYGDVEKIVEILNYLIVNKEKVSEITNNARNYAIDKFTKNKTAKKIKIMVDELC